MKQLFKSKLFRHFLPFMILVIGGSFFVQEFQKIRFKYRKVQSYQDFAIETKKLGITVKKPVTLEEEYEKIKTIDIDNWENVRIPRPWEEPNSTSN